MRSMRLVLAFALFFQAAFAVDLSDHEKAQYRVYFLKLPIGFARFQSKGTSSCGTAIDKKCVTFEYRVTLNAVEQLFGKIVLQSTVLFSEELKPLVTDTRYVLAGKVNHYKVIFDHERRKLI